MSSLTLDPTAFPNAADVEERRGNLGRLNVTKTLGDANGDGLYESLYTLGGRSFSIWTTDGTQVFDSGSDFERIVAASNPAFFNASNDDRTFDSRSDNKGPEPEAVWRWARIGERALRVRRPGAHGRRDDLRRHQSVRAGVRAVT